MVYQLLSTLVGGYQQPIPWSETFRFRKAINMSSWVADGFYPKKNVNINVDGSCYEFLGSAFAEYKYLDTQKRTSILKAQYNAIEPPNALIPIIFSGTKNEITEFTDKYDIKVVEEQQVGDMNNKNSYIDKYIVKAMTAKPYFEQILNALTKTLIRQLRQYKAV